MLAIYFEVKDFIEKIFITNMRIWIFFFFELKSCNFLDSIQEVNVLYSSYMHDFVVLHDVLSLSCVNLSYTCVVSDIPVFSCCLWQHVTANGCKNMTNVPREIWEIEAVMAGAAWPLDKASACSRVNNVNNGSSC